MSTWMLTGRATTGRFPAGNRIATADHNPLCREVTRLKRAFVAVVTPEEVQALAARLLWLCYDPDPGLALAAAELLLNRLLGKPKEHVQRDVEESKSLAIASRPWPRERPGSA